MRTEKEMKEALSECKKSLEEDKFISQYQEGFCAGYHDALNWVLELWRYQDDI